MDIRTYALLAGASSEDASAAQAVYDFLTTEFPEEKYYYIGLTENEEYLNGRIGRVIAAALAYSSGIMPEEMQEKKPDHSKQATRFTYVYKALEEMKEVSEETTELTINVHYPTQSVAEETPVVPPSQDAEQDTGLHDNAIDEWFEGLTNC